MFIRGGKTVFAYFIGQGRTVEVKEGAKISIKLGYLIIICYIAKLLKYVIFNYHMSSVIEILPHFLTFTGLPWPMK